MVVVEKQCVLHNISVCVCVCVNVAFSYPACNAHAHYCYLWPVWLCVIFPHYLIKGTIFEEKNVAEHKMCFDFLYSFCLKHFSF
jgi:hypothetical protein